MHGFLENNTNLFHKQTLMDESQFSSNHPRNINKSGCSIYVVSSGMHSGG